NRDGAEVPCRRTIAARRAPRDAADRFDSADHLHFLRLRRQGGWDGVGIAVMRNLVPRLDDAGDIGLVTVDNDAGDEPSRADLAPCQKVDEAASTDEAELAARDRCRGGETAGGETGPDVEIEGEASDVAHSAASPCASASSRATGR